MEKSLFRHLTGTAALASRILYKLDELVGYCDETSKRELQRSMNANKHPLWSAAWKIVTERGCVQVTLGKNRQQFVRLLRVPMDLQWQTRLIRAKPPRRRRRRTPWFKQLLPIFLRRDGYDELAEQVEAEGDYDEDNYGPLQYVPGDPLAR